MMQPASQQSPQRKYLVSLISKQESLQSKEKLQLSSIINASMLKVQLELQRGDIQVTSQQNIQEQLSRIKKDRYNKQMELLSKQIDKNDEMYKKAKREMIRQKKSQSDLAKEQSEAKRKQIIERVKKWSELQKELKEKRTVLEAMRQRQQNQQRERLKKEQEEMSAFQKLEKKKVIEHRLKQIEENRVKREETVKNAENLYQQLNPKYLQIEKKFRQLQEEMKFEEQILKKNHKLSQKIDHDLIKAHEKKYLAKVQERKITRKDQNDASPEEREEGYIMYVDRDEARIAAEKMKFKKRREFQERIKEIPIAIDEAKRIKMEIEIDKGKNPLKYNFLGQKALNEFQIFGEFKDFEINVKRNQLGNEYLKELPSINANSRVTKSQSLHALSTRAISQKVKYKDYLQDMKLQRTERGEKEDEQITKIIREHKEKSKAIAKLSEQSQKYELQAKRGLLQLERESGFRSGLRKSKEVDDMYLKSIKAKLACLEMTE